MLPQEGRGRGHSTALPRVNTPLLPAKVPVVGRSRGSTCATTEVKMAQGEVLRGLTLGVSQSKRKRDCLARGWTQQKSTNAWEVD